MKFVCGARSSLLSVLLYMTVHTYICLYTHVHTYICLYTQKHTFTICLAVHDCAHCNTTATPLQHHCNTTAFVATWGMLKFTAFLSFVVAVAVCCGVALQQCVQQCVAEMSRTQAFKMESATHTRVSHGAHRSELCLTHE